MQGVTSGLRKISGTIPRWSNHLDKPVSARQLASLNNGQEKGTKVLYFSACINRMLGGDTYLSFGNICKKAKIELRVTKATATSCCGQIFSSKGFANAHQYTVNQTVEKLFQDSNHGSIPIVLDVTSCTQTLLNCRPYLSEKNQLLFDQLKILDIIDFIADMAIPRLTISQPKDKVVFHPVCSVHKMGTLGKLKSIGFACAKQADIPVFAGCCGMAGDRGFYYPGLTEAATKRESNEVNQQPYSGYYSTSKTCEIAMSEASGHDYQSILKLVDEVSSD
jgi:D-lactate dehydrogenase